MTTSRKDDAHAPDPAREPAPSTPDATTTNPREGLDREVGDLDDADAVDEDGALPGRVGGGLAGG